MAASIYDAIIIAGRPDDIAGAVAFPCSDDARFIAGEVLTVDSGWMAARYLPPDRPVI